MEGGREEIIIEEAGRTGGRKRDKGEGRVVISSRKKQLKERKTGAVCG